MTRPSPRLAFLVVVLLLSATVAVAPIAASSYDASVAGSIDVPDRTIEVKGEQSGVTYQIDFDISSIARVEPGETIDVDTTGPENGTYYAEKFNSDGERLVSTKLTGDNSTSFLTANDDPGTYLVAIRIDGYDFADRAVPVVVAAYDANLTVPDEAAPGETVTATIELEPYDQAPAVDSVELTLMNGSDEEPEPIPATPTDEGNRVYEAEITVPETEGKYAVFSAVFGEDSLTEDEQEMLEITETSIEVSEDAAGGETGDSSGKDTENTNGSSDDGSVADGSDGTSNRAGSDGESVDTNETGPGDNGTDVVDGNGTDDTSTDIGDGNGTDDNSTDTDGSTGSGPSNDETNSGSSDSSGSTSDSDDPIEPNDTTGDGVVTEEQVPLTGIPHMLVAVLAIGLLSRRRSGS